jgi:hypothetical protein
MDHSMTETLKQQTQILFANIETTFQAAEKFDFNKSTIRAPLWKHFYHMLHSLDQWFINPFRYTEPDFHTTGLNLIDHADSEKSLSRHALHEYYKSIRVKTEKYLQQFDVVYLQECPLGSEFNGFTLILAQFRHVMYHIGFIHACIMQETGKMPEFIGISPPLGS